MKPQGVGDRGRQPHLWRTVLIDADHDGPARPHGQPIVNGFCSSNSGSPAPTREKLGCWRFGMRARIASWNAAYGPEKIPSVQTALRFSVNRPLLKPSLDNWSS